MQQLGGSGGMPSAGANALMILFTIPSLCFDATIIVQKLSRGTVLAKLDLKVPIYPDDHAILGIRWGTNVHVYKHSSPSLRVRVRVL